MKPLEEIILGRDQPVIMLLLEGCGWKKKNAMLVAAFLQVTAIILLFVAIGIFLEWRLVQWENLGCKAYCDCVARMGNITYSLMP